MSKLGIRLRFAGDVCISQEIIEAVVVSEAYSLGVSLVVMLGIVSALERSLWLGLVCTLPSFISVAVILAGMGFGGVSLGVATSLFASITIGVGVDGALHVVGRYRRYSGDRQHSAIMDAIGHTCPAIVLETLVLSCGFCVLMLSSVPTNRYLGCLLLSSFVTCSICTLFLVPVLVKLGEQVRSQSVVTGEDYS